MKYDGGTGETEAEVPHVPHGNKNDLKDEIRSDSSTAQLPIIRTVLSMAALHKLKIATLDISKAYLQA